ncbi:MAG: hypothetical protein AB1Z65_16825, partial [Candidatus Sulfomarinibacteraceae bacterium]
MGRARRLRYRHLRRTIIAVLATIAAFLLVALILRMLLTSGPTRRLARNWIVAVAEQRGFDLDIDDLSWGFLPPRIQLSGVRMEGPGIQARIDSAEVELARVRLTSQTIDLGTVAADGIRVRLDHPPRREPGRESRLKVKIRHLQLTDLEFEGTDLPGRIDLSIDGMDAGWTTEDGPPTGFARIDRVDLQIPGLRPITTAVAARLIVDDGVRIPSWTIQADGIELGGEGTLGGAEGTRIVGVGSVDLVELDRVVKAGDILSGTIEVEAVFDPHADERLRVGVQSRRITAAGFPLEDVTGAIVLADDTFRGDLQRATFFGGRLEGTYRGELGGGFPHSVRVNGRSVGVAGILGAIGIPSAGISAVLDTDVTLDWSGKSFPLGRGRADAVFRPVDGPLPASGPLTVELNGDRALTFTTDGLQIGGSTMMWQGPLSIGTWEPSWSVSANPAVLEEVVPMVNAWIGSRALPDVQGSGRLQASLSGPWQELVVKARLDARPLQWGPISLDHVVASALIGGQRLTLEPSRFRVGEGAGEVEGTMTWDPAAVDEQLALDLRGHRIPLATVAEWADQGGMAEGDLSFTGGLRGPLELPRGSWAAGLSDVSIAGLALGDATATIDLANGTLEARGIEFNGGLAGRVAWQVMGGTIDVDLGWPGMPLDFLGETVTGTVGETADVRLVGGLTPDGRPAGTLEAVTEDGLVEVRAEPENWIVRGALADALEGSVELRRTQDGHLAGNGRLTLNSAQDLLARVLPGSGIPLEGSASVGIDVDWPTSSTPVISATVEELGLTLQDDPIRLLGPAHFDLSAAGLEVRDLYLAHRDDRVFMRWGIGSDGSLRGNATGTLDALLLRFLVPEWEPAGRATGVIEMLGTLDRPRFEGIAEIAQGSFRLPGGQTILSGIDGTVLLSEDEVIIDGSGFRFMQGRGVAGGRINWRAGIVSLDLAGQMSDLRYPVLPGIVARLSGPWRLSGPADDLHISGDLTVDRASLQRREAPSLLLLEWFGGPPSPPT